MCALSISFDAVFFYLNVRCILIKKSSYGVLTDTRLKIVAY